MSVTQCKASPVYLVYVTYYLVYLVYLNLDTYCHAAPWRSRRCTSVQAKQAR